MIDLVSGSRGRNRGSGIREFDFGARKRDRNIRSSGYDERYKKRDYGSRSPR